jgi:hypothetical protein
MSVPLTQQRQANLGSKLRTSLILLPAAKALQGEQAKESVICRSTLLHASDRPAPFVFARDLTPRCLPRHNLRNDLFLVEST